MAASDPLRHFTSQNMTAGGEKKQKKQIPVKLYHFSPDVIPFFFFPLNGCCT